MEDGQNADAGAEVLGFGSNGGERLGRCLEQETVDHGLVLVGDVAIRAGKVKTRWKSAPAAARPRARPATLVAAAP